MNLVLLKELKKFGKFLCNFRWKNWI